jgi:low temperature requirement protein LtrA
LTMAMLFTSAAVFLGLFFAFSEGGSNRSYIAWYVEVLLLGLVTLIRPRYVVLVVEAIVVVIISSLWRVLSFKHTHLVERIGLLTLIILGEGILGLTKSVAKIVSKTGKVTGGDLGIIVAAVFLVVSTFDVCWTLRKGKY